MVVYNGSEPPAVGATIPVDWTRVIREGQQVAVLHGESGWLQFSKRAKYDLRRVEDWWEAEVAEVTRQGCPVTVRRKQEQPPPL